MAKERQLRPTSEQQSPEKETTVAKSSKSNSEQIQEIKKSEFIGNYQAALGETLGSKLYEAIAKELSFDKMRSLAEKAISGLADAGIDWANDSLYNGQLNKEQTEQLANALTKDTNALAQEYLQTESGQSLMNTMQRFVGQNPYAVVGVGILAAVGAIIADVDLPEIKQKLKLGKGFSLLGGAKLGSIRNIALESVSLGLGYKKDELDTSLMITRGEEGELSGKHQMTLGNKERHIKTDVEFKEEGITAYNISGLYHFNKDTSISGSASAKGEQVSKVPDLTLQVKTKSENFVHIGKLEYSGGQNTFTGLYNGSSDKLKYGLMLQADLSEGGSGGISKFGGDIKYSPDGSESNYYGAAYQSDLLNKNHSLDLSAQKRVTDDLTLRGTQGFDYNQDRGLSSNTELLGAYKMSNDLSLIGGAEYNYDQQNGGRVLPKIGVQYKDVPAVITFDPENKGISVGITFKF